jgi:hypothetical protein
MPKYLLFLAYTKQQVAQCRYFLIKYLALYNLKPPTDTTAVIYTSDPVNFENFGNFFKHFEMPDIAGNTFTRTTALHHFFHQHSGVVLFCDTATYPLQPLEHLFADIEKGALYLHSPKRYSENELTKARRPFSNLRDKTETHIATPTPAHINVSHAAVVGMNGQHQELLTKLLHEESIAATPLALDYSYTKIFSEAGNIKSAAKYIFEYSSLPEFSQLLETFFKKNEEESISNQIKLLHHIDAAAIQQQKEQYLQQPLFKKWLQIITGKKWTIKQYESRF